MPRSLPNWLDAYLTMTASQESPAPFHLWTALWTLGVVADQQVFYDRLHYRLTPHFYVVLVAGSGRCRKTTAASIGVNMVRALTAPPIPVFAQKITPEALITDLSAQASVNKGTGCRAVIFASELATLMGKEERYSGLEAMLTDLYDDHRAGWEYKTKTKGNFKVPSPTVHFLGCTTVEWLKGSFNASSIGGGLASRIMFVYQQTTDRFIPFPEDAPAETRELKARLITDLAHIRTLKGEFKLSGEAKKWFEGWYRERQEPHHELDGYYSRKPDHAIRLGMVYSLARKDALVLEIEDLKKAVAALDALEDLVYIVYATIAETPQASRMNRALQTIKQEGKGGIQRTVLLRKCWRFGSAREVDEWLSMFKQAQLVEERTDAQGRVYLLRDAAGYEEPRASSRGKNGDS